MLQVNNAILIYFSELVGSILEVECIILRQIGSKVIVCCQDRIIIAEIISEPLDAITYVKPTKDKTLLDLTTII